MDCKIIKLNNGEEIIANVEENTEKLIVDQPMMFVTSFMTDPFGRTVDVTYLKDWLSHSDNKKIELDKNRIVMMTDASKKSVKIYNLEREKYLKTEESIVVDGEQSIQDMIQEMDRMVDQMVNESSEPHDVNTDFPFQEEEPYPARKKKKKKKRSVDNSMIPDELKDRPMLYLNMIIPPEAIMNLISSGILDPEMIQTMIDEVKKKNKFTGDEKTREDFGNKYSDWNPDPKSDDYI